VQAATQGFPEEELGLGLQQMGLPMQSSQSYSCTLQTRPLQWDEVM